MTSKNSISRFVLLSATAVFFAGCTQMGFTPAGTSTGDAESILEAEGQYELVEQTDYDPEAAHQRSRDQVNPSQLSKSKSYTGDAKTANVDEEVHTRVLKMERDVEIVANEFKGLKSVYAGRTVAVEPASGSSDAHTSLSEAKAPVLSKSLKTQGGEVQKIRTGEYPDRTRLVIDLNAPAEFAYDFDQDQNLLIIRLSATDWSAPKEKRYAKSNALQGYAAKIAENGQALVAFKLKGPSKVLRSEKLGKNTDGHYRIFFDIAPI